MGKFKLNAPYKLDPIPRYEVPFQPDNTEDDSGLVAKANKNGTMIVNKNIPIDDPIRKEAESHEDHHIKDMMDGKLDYDDEKVYETISNGEVKEHSREDFNESDKNLAWEKDAYKDYEALDFLFKEYGKLAKADSPAATSIARFKPLMESLLTEFKTLRNANK